MENTIGTHMVSYRDEMLEDIVRLVRIPSVRGAAEPGRPFGDGPAEALAYCLDLGRALGFKVKNVGNYAGHIEYGEGENLLGVLAHADVVPAGDGWTMEPFGGEIKDGRLYGRGTMDDKSEAVAAIYCLKALRDLGIAPKAKIRVIIGAGEETGMEDMEHYFAGEQMPDFAFSPDSEYPICNREKGILQIRVSGETGCSALRRLQAGTAPNAVPISARAEISAAAVAVEEASREDPAARYEWKRDGSCVVVTCTGRAAHASEPEMGVNAAAHLAALIARLLGKTTETGGQKGLLPFLTRCVGLGVHGEEANVACEDDESGKLTLNLGIVDIEGDAGSAVLDIRYPVTGKSGGIVERICQKAGEYGLKAEVIHDDPPLFIPADNALIRKLSKAYETILHQEAGVYATGGGTYARALHNRGVAFGAGFRNLSYYHIHSADEFLVIDEFIKHSEICLQAMYEIACR